MKPVICLKHQVVFRICSTFEEQKNNQYRDGMKDILTHFIIHDGKGCKLVPVDFQKAKDYDGN